MVIQVSKSKVYPKLRILLACFILASITVLFYVEKSFNNCAQLMLQESTGTKTKELSTITLAVVSCGKGRQEETLVLLKSAAALTKAPLHLLVYTDENDTIDLRNKLEEWPISILPTVTYEVKAVTYPDSVKVADWRKLFKPCASMRLFLPVVLQQVDSLLYVDTDVLFLRPLEKIWSHFAKMNSSQVAAMAPEHEEFSTGWYNRFAQHPYYGPLGVNSGVMLMNLTRLRNNFDYITAIQDIYRLYKDKLSWGDQDILNILFHFHPDKLYTYPCEWNYRSDHCMYSSICKTAETNGVSILHGSRGVFHTDKQPVFKAIYNIFKEYKLGSDLRKELLEPMRKAVANSGSSECSRVGHIFLKAMEQDLA